MNDNLFKIIYLWIFFFSVLYLISFSGYYELSPAPHPHGTVLRMHDVIFMTKGSCPVRQNGFGNARSQGRKQKTDEWWLENHNVTSF